MLVVSMFIYLYLVFAIDSMYVSLLAFCILDIPVNWFVVEVYVNDDKLKVSSFLLNWIYKCKDFLKTCNYTGIRYLIKFVKVFSSLFSCTLNILHADAILRSVFQDIVLIKSQIFNLDFICLWLHFLITFEVYFWLVRLFLFFQCCWFIG